MKNYLQKHQSFYVIFSENDVPKIKIEQVLYYLFKDPNNETQFPYIQYIDKFQNIVTFEEMTTQNTYYVHISVGSNKCFNFDLEEAIESMKNNLVIVLKEDEFTQFSDLTNMLALKERINVLEGMIDEKYGKTNEQYKEMLSFMFDYRTKLENQNTAYKEENEILENIEKEARMLADQYEKARISLEKNIFYYRKKP